VVEGGGGLEADDIVTRAGSRVEIHPQTNRKSYANNIIKYIYVYRV
jgi:hypothetical protein